MQQKNFWLFLLLSMTILLVWSWVQIQFAPESDGQNGDSENFQLSAEETEKLGRTTAIIGTGFRFPPNSAGYSQLLSLTAASAQGMQTPIIEPPKTKKKTPKPKDSKPEDSKPKDSKPAKVEVTTIGGDGFFLKAKLTTRGAGVQRLTLTKFQAADWEGLPVTNDQGEPVELDLIPEDPFRPSFLMFHYADPEDARPLNTLGEKIWSLKKTKSGKYLFNKHLFSVPESPADIGHLNGRAVPAALREEFKERDIALSEKAKVKVVNADDEWRITDDGNKSFPVYRGSGSLDIHNSNSNQKQITFITNGPPGYEHLLIRKIYSLSTKSYHLGLKIEIEDTGEEKGDRPKFRYQLSGAHGMPIEGGWHTYTHRNAMIGMVDNRDVLWRTMEPAAKISFRKGGDRVPGGTRGEGDIVQYGGVTTQYFAAMIAVDNEQEEGVKPHSILAYARPTLESQEKKCFVDDVFFDQQTAEVRIRENNKVLPAMSVHLLPLAVKALKKLNLERSEPAIVNLYTAYQNGERLLVATNFRRGTEIKPYLEDITVRVVSEEVEIGAKESVAHQYVLYHGPVKVRQLGFLRGDKAVDPELVSKYADTLHLATLTDYPTVTWLSWWSDLLIFCTKVMHRLLHWLYLLVPIEGLTIILLTVIVRGLMFPISRKQAMTTMRMQQLQPEMKKIQEKYKSDMQAKQQAMMELYRKHKVNPFGGCLPLFIQLPIFLGLFYALQESIRFRLASFLWIDNLSAPDMLFYWGQSIPWITSPDSQGGFLYLGPYFNLLPILAVSIMLIHQKMVMPPAVDEQQQMQQKMMTYMMFVIAIMFYKVAAGLCIYFTASTLWGVLERKFLPKKKTGPTAATEAPAPSTTTSAKSAGKDGKPKVTPAQRRKARGKKKKEEPDTAAQKVKHWWEEVLKQAKKK